jgi:hypothetical protein
MKTYSLRPDGTICEASKFVQDPVTVQASTKTEATQKLLAQLFHLGSRHTSLYVRNGAYLLVEPSREGGFNASSGSLDRAKEDGALFALCQANHKTERDALADKSFAYYASDEFQKA